jgi:hypothetical protein
MILAPLAAVLAALAAAGGLLWPGGGGPVEVETARGTVARRAGAGLYRHDTVFAASLFALVAPLDHDTTFVTYALDLAVIAPACVAAGEAVGPIASFLAMGLLGAWVLSVLLRRVP